MLFNKSNNGAAELKSLLGFIYASRSFDNLITDIEIAEDEFRSLLGNELFEAIEEFYNSDDYPYDPDGDPEEGDPGEGDPGEEPEIDKALFAKLVRYIQLPIAFYAYRNYSSNADLSHSDKGRQIYTSENEKPAFEWMIDRDDHAMLMKAHVLTDRLLSFLELNKEDASIKELWIETDAYNASKNNIIGSAKVFSQIFPISDSPRFYFHLIPFIGEIENTRIIPVVTQEVYDEMLTEVRTPAEPGPEPNPQSDIEYIQNLILYARVPLVLLTMSLAMKRLAVEVLPEGVFQNYISGSLSTKAKDPVSFLVRNEVSQNLEKDGLQALQKLQQFISQHDAEEAGDTYTVESPVDRHSSDNQFFRV